MLIAVPRRRHLGAVGKPRATQWFVVSDIGPLSSFCRRRRAVGSFARSLGLPPSRSMRVELQLSGAQQRGAGHGDDRCRRAWRAFDPGLMRGAAAMAPVPPCWASGSDGDFVFLRPDARGFFDLSDRGVEGRAAPGALDILCLDGARHLPRRRDGACDGTCPATMPDVAVENLPLTLHPVRAPMASRTPPGQPATERAPLAAIRWHWTYPTPPCAAPGRLAIHTDADRAGASPPSPFWFEDFVPDRLRVRP